MLWEDTTHRVHRLNQQEFAGIFHVSSGTEMSLRSTSAEEDNLI